MNKQPTRIRTALNALAGVTLALGICAVQSALADEGTFTVASLQGRYAYVNNTEGVASFGPMSFDGRGGVTLSETVNLPCANPAQSCDRTIDNITATGTYTVNSDGTGVATFAFKFADGTPIGTEEYDFVINAATRKGTNLLATQIFAADRSGGLAGQLVAPTWSQYQTEHRDAQQIDLCERPRKPTPAERVASVRFDPLTGP